MLTLSKNLGQSKSVFWDECIPLQFSRMVVTWARKVLKTFEKQLWIDGAVSQLYQLAVMCLYVLLLRHNFETFPKFLILLKYDCWAITIKTNLSLVFKLQAQRPQTWLMSSGWNLTFWLLGFSPLHKI